MIKFFRKIRYNLMENGKTGKYFKYAIGEIILVMIGILLALQVNIWNENRKSHNEINDLLLDLEEFMGSQKAIIGGELLRIKKTDSVFKLIKENRLKDTMSITPSELQKALFDPREFPYIGIPKYQIEFSNITNLINRKEDFPKNYWSMIYDLESLKVYSEEIVHLSAKLSQLSKSHLTFLLENKPHFFENNEISYRALKNYVLKDATFEIRRLEIMNYLDEIIKALERYNFNSAKLNGTIKYLIHNNNGKQIDNLWSGYNMVKILTKKCQNKFDENINSLSKSHSSVLVFNNQVLPITFEFYNKENNIVKERTFSEQGVFPLRLRTQEINTTIRYTIGDKCYVIANPVNNGYLIIN